MRYVILLLLIVTSVSTSARDLSLGDAYTLARQHAYSLKKAAAERQAAESALNAAKSERFPTLSAAAGARYISYVPTLNINIPPNLHLTREVGTKENYQTDLLLTMPILTGGKIGGAIDLAKATRDYYQALEQADIDQLYRLTRVEYLGLYRMDRALGAANAALKRTRVIAADVDSAFAGGVADSVDVLEAQLAVSNAEFGVKRAESDRRSSEIRLDVLLGLPADESLNLTAELPSPEPAELPSTVASDKPELAAADMGVKMNQSAVKLSKANYFPTLSAFGGYSYGKPNLDRFNNTWNDYFTVGATLSWSFNLWGKTVHKSSQARWNLEASRQQRDNVAEQLDRGAKLAIEQVKLAYERYRNAQQQYTISSNNYRLAKMKHDEGALSTNHLLEIDANLTVAEASLAAAEAGYHIAMSNYYYAVGSPELREGK
jgi:outer membrane protein